MLARLLAIAAAFFAPHPAPGCERYVARASYAGGTWSVVPTACGRRRAWLEPRRAFAEMPPAQARRSLYLQFRCHAIFAAAKPDWDLEDYRPVVAWRDLIVTACNP